MYCRMRQLPICLLIVLLPFTGGFQDAHAFIQDADSPDSQVEKQEEREDGCVAEDPLAEILRGHSFHGEAFNEGPRQKAYLMGGTGAVDFEVTTDSELAQKFINQGVGQLHGFWDLEAERSFRQAAALDETCAMAYWGAAWAASSDKKRARGFIETAVKHKQNVTERERLYIEALEKYLGEKPAEKEKRAAQFLKDLESIVMAFPDDLEAKAFVAHRVWQNAQDGIPIASYLGTDAFLKQIYEIEPLHPAHHYTIHLWDHRRPKNALQSAARCGIAAPSIAHMWHMPGHIYSRLKRYEDAIYQQEASARVDHAHMMRDHVMPDEIGNFAHNNEWLIRNLVFVGRVNDALELARNMVELPQHPKYNTLEKKSGSASYGRRRLLQTLREFELWQKAIQLCQSPVLDPPGLPAADRVKTLRLLGCAAAITGNDAARDDSRDDLQTLIDETNAILPELEIRVGRLKVRIDDGDDRPPVAKLLEMETDKANEELKKKTKDLQESKSLVDQIEKAQLAIDGYQLIADQDYKLAHEKLLKATGEDVSWLGELQFLGGDADEGIKAVKKQVERRSKEVIPLARLAFLQHQNGDVELAKESFEQLRDTSGSLDLAIPMFSRLQPIADLLELGPQWKKPYEPPVDLGFRPELDSLGPFRWSPPAAPTWSLLDSADETVGSNDFPGQPYVVIFYLGHGCLHCAEQLQKFLPRVNDFREAGIELVAISSDDAKGLQKSLEAFGDELPMRLASDGSLEIFKKFRAYDDFESQPLHGTFLVDGAGKIRWQDIGYQPFMDDDFLLAESKRLLAAHRPAEDSPSVSQK